MSSCVLSSSRSEAESADLVIFKDHFSMPTFKRPLHQIWMLYLLGKLNKANINEETSIQELLDRIQDIQTEDFSSDEIKQQLYKKFSSKQLRKIAKIIRLDLWVEAENYVDFSVFSVTKRNLLQLLIEWREKPSFEHTEK